MEKIKIVFHSNGKKVVDYANDWKSFEERMTGTGMLYGVTLWNSELVEVYHQDDEDRRRWKPWRRFTNESMKVK